MMQQWRRAWGPWDVHHLLTQPAQHSTHHCWGRGLKRSLWQAWASGSRKGKLHVPVLAFNFPGATCPCLEVLSPSVGGRTYNRLCWGCFNYPRGQRRLLHRMVLSTLHTPYPHPSAGQETQS